MEDLRERVAVIGYSGTIGKYVVEALEEYDNGRAFEIIKREERVRTKSIWKIANPYLSF